MSRRRKNSPRPNAKQPPAAKPAGSTPDPSIPEVPKAEAAPPNPPKVETTKTVSPETPPAFQESTSPSADAAAPIVTKAEVPLTPPQPAGSVDKPPQQPDASASAAKVSEIASPKGSVPAAKVASSTPTAKHQVTSPTEKPPVLTPMAEQPNAIPIAAPVAGESAQVAPAATKRKVPLSDEIKAKRARDAARPSLSQEREGLVIHADHLNHFYGEGENKTQVLFDNCLTIGPGEIVIMTGPSGSGKTTLLTLIGALRQVQQGSLNVLGLMLNKSEHKEQVLLRQKIGFIFQAHNLFSSLTAIENVRMAMELQPYSPKEMTRRATMILERLGLADRIHYKPGNLSGGQRQRVAIARALVNEPPLILADEPTAALDAASGETVMELFRELAVGQRRSTILVVTHDKRLIDRASRIVNMVRGNIISNVVTGESIKIVMSLSRSDAFKNLNENLLTEMADKMRREIFREGAEIIRQGDVGERFYVINVGTVAVHRNGMHMQDLNEGDFFGEIALMQNIPRSATVTAKTDVEVFWLSKEDFKEALSKSESLEHRLRKLYMDRQ